MTTAEVRTMMLAKLKLSGLSPAKAAKLKLEPYNSESVAAKLPLLPEYRGGFTIPYFDVEGKPTKHYRFRYLEPASGFAGVTGKALRYAQPKGSDPYLYFTPGAPWKYIRESEDPLYVTEGEIKSAAACYADLPTVGLGGVNMYAKKGEMLAAWAKFKLRGRPVYILFDSDSVSNPNVRRAETGLARALLNSYGAVPYIVRLPNVLGEGEKTGLDDYLVKVGAGGLGQLIAATEPYAAAKALHELAEEVIYINEADIIYNFEKGIRMRTDKFVSSHYANRILLETRETSKGSVTIEKSAPAEFMKWAYRPEVQRFTFAPGEPRLVREAYNLWAGWPVAPAKGDVSLWHSLLDHIFANKPREEREWFERWVAYPIQYPGAKHKTAVVVWGGQGTGKSFLGEIIMRLYGEYSTKFNNTSLNSSFNDWAESKQFALGEEIVINMDDRGAISEQLKQLITDDTITINRKYVNTYNLPSCMNMMIVSNHSVAIKVENDDRRYFVIRATNGKLLPSLYVPLDRWSKSEEGVAALFHYLLNLPLKGFDPNAEALATSDKYNMVDSGSSAHEAWVREITRFPDQALVMGKLKLPYELWTAEELLRLFKSTEGNEQSRLTVATLGATLAMMGLHKAYPGPIRTKAGQKNLWIVPRFDDAATRYRGATPIELGRVYDEERADKAFKFARQVAEKKSATKRRKRNG